MITINRKGRVGQIQFLKLKSNFLRPDRDFVWSPQSIIKKFNFLPRFISLSFFGIRSKRPWQRSRRRMRHVCAHTKLLQAWVTASPTSFKFIFGLFQTNVHSILANKLMWNKSPSSIRCWDLNPRPSVCESHPITTRPEPPHKVASSICHGIGDGVGDGVGGDGLPVF